MRRLFEGRGLHWENRDAVVKNRNTQNEVAALQRKPFHRI